MNMKSLCAFAIVGLLFTTVGARAAAAQTGKINCESAGGGYQYCRVDTDNVVKLERKLSFSECTYNYSWGYDRRGIWVDRGCRAEFSYGKSGSNSGAAVAAGAIIGGAILAGVLASRGGNKNDINTENEAYNFGYSQGRNDALGGLSNDPGRHDDRVGSNVRNEYRNGYRNGFQSGSNSSNYPSYGSGTSNDERAAYQRGYTAGSRDASAHQSSDFTRYRSEFNRNTRASFRNGYEAGYSSRNNNSWNRPSYGNSMVPNWLIGTWQTNQGSQRLNLTFTSSGQVTVVTIPNRGQRTTSSGYFRNGTMVIPGFASYDVRQQGGQMLAVNVRNSSDQTRYTRIR
ncbi:MAG: DUF3011 domain-containing protein [Aridibacter famidurans]|nr:DUF3011 domain-containing protein [Aridibacter famidurans]